MFQESPRSKFSGRMGEHVDGRFFWAVWGNKNRDRLDFFFEHAVRTCPKRYEPTAALIRKALLLLLMWEWYRLSDHFDHLWSHFDDFPSNWSSSDSSGRSLVASCGKWPRWRCWCRLGDGTNRETMLFHVFFPWNLGVSSIKHCFP